MAASFEDFFDYYEAEREADRIAGDYPGTIAWVIESWDSLVRFEDGCEGDLHVVRGDSIAECLLLLRGFDYWQEQYDATKHKEPVDG